MANSRVYVNFQDNSTTVKTQMTGNAKAALSAMGIKAVGCIVNQIQTGYADAQPGILIDPWTLGRVAGITTDISHGRMFNEEADVRAHGNADDAVRCQC